MNSSFNAFGQGSKKFGGNTPVWLGTVKPIPVGGSLAAAYAVPGAHYPAGTPINITNKVITPMVAYLVTKVATVGANDVATVRPLAGIAPAAGAVLQVLGATFATKGTAGAVVSAAKNAEDAELLDIAYATGTMGSVAQGSVLVASASQTAGSSKSIAVTPNAYLYNDIHIGLDVDENVGASGAAVQFHAEGILIDRTPAAEFAGIMAEAVPHVLQVKG